MYPSAPPDSIPDDPDPEPDPGAGTGTDITSGTSVVPRNPNYPDYFSWTNNNGRNYLTPIKHQTCGTCYAFALAAACEFGYNRFMGYYNNDARMYDFSEAFLAFDGTLCSGFSYYILGCDGGRDPGKTDFVCTYGLPLESDRPFTLAPGTINWNYPRYKMSRRYTISSDIYAIKSEIMQNGPVIASLLSSYPSLYFNHPGGSILKNDIVCGPPYASDHDVVIVGFGYDSSVGDYWIVRDSHGTEFCENGYIRVEAHSCKINCAIRAVRYDGPTLLNSPNYICSTSSNSFSIQNPAWLTSYVNWVTSPSNLVTPSSGMTGSSNPFTFNLSPVNSNSQGWVTVSVTPYISYYGCPGLPQPPNPPLTKTIWVGPPLQPTILGPSQISCSWSGTIWYHISMNQPNTIQWSVLSGPINIVGSSNEYQCQVVPHSPGGQAQLKVRITNDCQLYKEHILNIAVTNCGSPDVYPNPTTTSFFVDMSGFEPDNSSLTEDYTITVVGSDNNQHIKYKSKDKKKEYDVSKMPKGQAYVTISFKGQEYGKILIIQ